MDAKAKYVKLRVALNGSAGMIAAAGGAGEASAALVPSVGGAVKMAHSSSVSRSAGLSEAMVSCAQFDLKYIPHVDLALRSRSYLSQLVPG